MKRKISKKMKENGKAEPGKEGWERRGNISGVCAHMRTCAGMGSLLSGRRKSGRTCPSQAQCGHTLLAVLETEAGMLVSRCAIAMTPGAEAGPGQFSSRLGTVSSLGPRTLT